MLLKSNAVATTTTSKFAHKPRHLQNLWELGEKLHVPLTLMAILVCIGLNMMNGDYGYAKCR